MTVFVAHALADEEAADSLAKAIERRGHFVEHEHAERIGRPLLGNDALVLLWSRNMLNEPGRFVMERRALDAWADGKLIVAALDRTLLPVGLRDLPVVDATFEARRNVTWDEVAAKLRDLGRAPAAEDGALPPPASAPARAPAPPGAAAKRGGGNALLALVCLVLVIAGILQAVGGVTFSAGGFEVPRWSLLAFAALCIALALVPALFRSKPRAPAAAPAPRPAEAQAAAALFVSYAHADDASVRPVVEAVKHEGREVWMDREGIQAGDGWAGEIVRAIKAAHGVMVMCSPHAFESDHVKREVYLADRYKKPMLPVFLEPAELPEDFEYFFANVQWLELHKTPEAERGAAIAKAVAAV
jgi:hypothetical protein